MICQGFEPRGVWWKPGAWEKLRVGLPGWLVERLEVHRGMGLRVEEQLQGLTERLAEAAKGKIPHGFGGLTWERLNREIGDWKRFGNRRQVGSYTGLCPGQSSSGPRTCYGSITKHGNPRVRHWLVELAWRVVKFQPADGPVRKWKPILCNPRATSAARKKAVVALGRRLAVDLWRLHTGRSTAEALHLEVKA